MKIIVKKTNELSADEKNEICNLFFDVFEKEKSIEDFNKQFLATILGYSFHGLIIVENKIVGCYSAIPFEYNFFDKHCTFALSVDTMITKEYRGNPFTLKNVSNLVYEKLREDNIPFVFGFPNDNVYLIRKKVLKWKDIAQLDYYMLPIRIGNIKKLLFIFNSLSVILSRLMVIPIKVYNQKNTQKYNIEKINNDKYISYRYSQFNGTYKIIKDESDNYFSYKSDIYEGTKVIFLVDVFPMSKSHFEHAVKYIRINESNHDAVLFVGHLNFKPLGIFKIPKKYEPKTVYMSGKILDDTIIDNRIFNISNWNVNLSNYDVV